MAELTGQETVSDIARRLRNRFSTTEFAEVYKDKPVQSMKTPCIFIHLVESNHDPEGRKYAWWDHTIDIRCHPGRMQTNIHTWASILGPAIVECVEYITIDNQQVRAKNASWRVENDVLHVVFNYRYRVLQKPESVSEMRTLTYGRRIK